MRALRLLLLSAVAVLALASPAHAFDWDDAEVMADEEMSDLRGGISITPQLEINFGATITTFVNGAPALSTQLTWTNAGQFIEQTVGEIGQRIEDLTPEARTALGVDGLENAGGVVIDDAEGVTALVHNVTEGALQNIILNTATGRDLRQEIDVTLTLPGFEAIQDSIILERLGIHLVDDMSVRFGG